MSDVEAAAREAGLDDAASQRLLAALSARQARRPRLDLVHVAYYLGALVMMLAMGWFLTAAWDGLGGGGIMAIGLVYAAAYAGLGLYLRRNPAQMLPGNLLITAAVALTPLVVYGFQRLIGVWPFEDPGEYRDFFHWVRGGWFAMEVGTIAVALAVIARLRFPFMVVIPAVMLWFISMDLTPILFHGPDGVFWEQRKLVSLVFGLGMLALAYAIDRRTRQDFAFWLYLFGLIAFWGGLTAMESDSELGKAVYGLINLGLLGLAVFLRRPVFTVFGAMGVCGYLGHLAHSVFADSLAFPLVLSVIGLAILLLGIWLNRRASTLEAWLQATLPAGVLALRPSAREG